MINKKRLFMAGKLIILFICLLVSFYFTPTVFSKYETEVTSSTDANIAFYLLEENYFTNSMSIEDMIPRSNPYVYTFTVSNFNNSNRLEVDLEYDLEIVTTTNLPLVYELYVNQNYDDNNAVNIISTDVTTADEDGTYFRHLETLTKTFGFTSNETNTYHLVIYFPTTYISYLYQGIVENIEVVVNSRQII